MTAKAKKITARKDPEEPTGEDKGSDNRKETPAPKAKKEKAEKPPKAPKPKKEKPVRAEPAHMSKVKKFKSNLPTLSDDAQAVFDSAQALSTGDLNVLSIHLTTLARERATAGASATKVNVGDRVRIHSGIDTRFIGREGVVSSVRRIRIFVRVPGFEKDAYLFSSNVEVVEAAPKVLDTTEDESDDQKAAANG